MRFVASLISFLAFALYSLCSTAYSVSDGLSNGSVKAIWQDSVGYMWFGTKNGLNRFDGYEFKTYYYRQEGQRQKNDIVSIQSDRKGRMWIGTFNGIVLFDPYAGSFIDLAGCYEGEHPAGVVVGVWISDDDVWVATKQGLYRFHDGTSSAIPVFRNQYINSMSHCGGDELILDVEGRGLVRFHTDSYQTVPVAGEDHTARSAVTYSFYDGEATTLLFVDMGHIIRYDNIRKKADLLDVTLPEESRWMDNHQVHGAVKQDDGSILLAADAGVVLLNIRTRNLQPYFDQSAPNLHLPSRTMSIFRDRNSSLWVGTFEDGVSIYNPDLYRIGLIPLADSQLGTPQRVISGLVEVSGKLVVGTRNAIAIIDLYDDSVISLDMHRLIKDSPRSSELFNISGYSDSQVIIYMLNLGSFILDLQDYSVRRCYENSLSPASQIRKVQEDIDGNLWLAADELCLLDKNNGTFSYELSTNLDGFTRYMLTQDIYMEKNGDMLVGTRNNGIWRYPYDRKSPSHYLKAERVDDFVPDDANVSSIWTDDKGNLWIGTYDSGIYMCGREKEDRKIFDMSQGLPHNTIYGITGDYAGNVWVSTHNGLAMIDRESQSVFSYTPENGYPLNGSSSHAFIAASNGRIYVGGNGGVAYFLPKVLSETRGGTHPDVVISEIESLRSSKDDGYITYDSPKKLKATEFNHNSTSIRVKVSSLDYLFQPSCSYAYRMVGVDKDWNYTDRNDIILSNLPYGKHTLEIKASDKYGVWSDKVTSQQIIIRPPFWWTLYAKILYVVLAVGLILLIFKYIYDLRVSRYKEIINKIEKDNIERSYKLRIDLFTQFSHELRTPLTLITAPIEDLLNDPSLPERFSYPIRQIDKNANRILLLVNQLLDFRKIENGNMKLRLSKIDLRRFLGEQVENFKVTASKRGIEIRFIDEFDPDSLWADSDLLDRIISNLMSNAIKNTPGATPIEVGTVRAGNNMVQIYVRDYGRGIAEAEQEKIFEPFYQVSTKNHLRSFGSGIGLTLVKYVVGLHKGRVWVESREGEGSKFVIELPLGTSHYNPEDLLYPLLDVWEQEKEAAPKVEAAVDEDDASFTADDRPVILIAEDDEELRHYVKEKLGGKYKVLEASDGIEAFDQARQHIPDLIVSDVMMPNMDGVELCRKVKAELATAHIPLILLTAKSESENIEEGYEALADDYVLKPFSSKILKGMIESLITNRARLRKYFSERLKDEGRLEVRNEDPFLNKLVDIIRSRVGEGDLSIADLSMEMGVSRAQLFRKVKAISDLSPNKLIISIRMNIASEMLRDGKLSISEVAYKLGYTDPSYFSKVFKSVYNISPTDYQRGHS